ncbi:hypothetical protein AOLI_G00316780 [Acnodon oligacanthus]
MGSSWLILGVLLLSSRGKVAFVVFVSRRLNEGKRIADRGSGRLSLEQLNVRRAERVYCEFTAPAVVEVVVWMFGRGLNIRPVWWRRCRTQIRAEMTAGRPTGYRQAGGTRRTGQQRVEAVSLSLARKRERAALLSMSRWC